MGLFGFSVRAKIYYDRPPLSRFSVIMEADEKITVGGADSLRKKTTQIPSPFSFFCVNQKGLGWVYSNFDLTIK
ncbi:MAG: hypothetical protein A3A24_00395 [Candidatus Buchananbacteria bacterium RIFCSPLOWO2_01_FULL_46_12]|uniref:Uncharacterized protein n=2 Tax=Candidatus Buchananiibacteriota TaxID=1817903 RepID=A0A1G1YS74_9BACT|nr:MAG: hypothetical protein A2744_02825 [Candidatus Buchananbacteria bacterium RIFCSPHIGHO2_01_FULL_44_11]OGY55181.1 MAG: hypothetical protein A3A24_00395 [Candidatus Buchananbacteria bacterium RIFCSPLOWO2_01_FULL_46_12]